MIDLEGRRPDFDRLLAAIAHEEPDTVPFAELVIEPDVKAAYLGRPMAGLGDEIEFWIRAGYDYVPLSVGAIRPGRALGGERAECFSVYEESHTERTWAAMGEGVIGTREDFAAFPWESLEAADVTVLDRAAVMLPPGMKIIAVIGKVFTGTWLLMGMEHFFLSTVQDPELVEMVYDRVARAQLALFERVVDHPVVGAVWHPDDLAGTRGPLLAPDHFRRFVFPWYRHMGEICRQVGKPMILHSDGNVAPLLDDILGCGFAALHPVEAKAMDIFALKASHGDRLALFGNVDLDFPLARGTPQDVEHRVRELIERLAPGGGYALSAGNSIPEYIPLANYEAMLRAGVRWGRRRAQLEVTP